jgi:hypothetical protein
MRLRLPYPRLPSLSPKTAKGKRTTTPSPTRYRRTYASSTLPFSFKSKPHTYQPTGNVSSPSTSSGSTSASLPVPRTPSSLPDIVCDAGEVPEHDTPEQAQNRSSPNSSTSSVRRTTTIVIEPSHALRAMQSVGVDTTISSHNATWHSSYRYLNQSQASILAPEICKPTGSPAWLLEELDPANYAPETRATLSDLQVRNWNPPSERDGPTTPSPTYGPSAKDLEDLIERRKKLSEQQSPKIWSPLHRLSSIKKELAGGLKRTMSIGKKKSFQPRVNEAGHPLRTKSEKQCKESKKILGFPNRSHTISAAMGRRGDIERDTNESCL